MSATAETMEKAKTVLKLQVRNHAGVMSHICGLFARRAFNVEGILCMPVGDGTCSGMLLLVYDDERLEQLTKQLAKLEDVVKIEREDGHYEAFDKMLEYIGS